MILPIARRGQILADIEMLQAVEVVELTERYGVSMSTIRRDLDVLAQLGLLTRVHGGAVAVGFGEFGADWAQPADVPAISPALTQAVSHRAAG